MLDKALQGRDGDSAVALESMMDGVKLLYAIHEQEEALHKLIVAWKGVCSPKSSVIDSSEVVEKYRVPGNRQIPEIT